MYFEYITLLLGESYADAQFKKKALFLGARVGGVQKTKSAINQWFLLPGS